MESTDEEVRYKNIKFGLPSEHSTESQFREAKKQIIDAARSLIMERRF